MKIILSILPVIMLMEISLFAQAPDTLWTKTYGGRESDIGFSVIETHKQHYVMAGLTASYGVGRYDVYVIMTDSDGDTIWTNTYGQQFSDVGYSIVETSDLGFAIAGATRSYGANSLYYKRLLIKTSYDGHLLWERAYGDSASHGWFYELDVTADSGFILVGAQFVSDEQQDDINLSKVDSSGNLLWSRTFGGPGFDSGWSVIQASDGGYAFVGKRERSLNGIDDLYAVKTDYLGYPVWTRIIQAESAVRGRSIIQTSDGGFIIAGIIYSGFDPPVQDWDIYFVKLSSSGNVLWSNTFGGDSSDLSSSVIETADNGFLISGKTHSYDPVSADVWVVKTDLVGRLEWHVNIGGSSDETGFDLIQTSDGYYLIVGQTLSYGNGVYDVYLIKLHSGLTGIFDSTVTGPVKKYIISQNYPNPFNPTTTIRYSMPEQSDVRIEIYNILGQLVATLFDGVKQPGYHTITWQADHYPSGVYFARLEAGMQSENIKMVLLK